MNNTLCITVMKGFRTQLNTVADSYFWIFMVNVQINGFQRLKIIRKIYEFDLIKTTKCIHEI